MQGMNEIRHTYHSQLDDLRVDVVRLGLLATYAITAVSFWGHHFSPPPGACGPAPEETSS